MQRLHASERELVSLFSAHSFCSHTKAGTAGRLFVCISASSEPREFWSVFSDAVVAMGHRCLTFDSYGRGATPMPADGYVTRDAEAELIAQLLDDLVGGEPCILVAHSSGGLGPPTSPTCTRIAYRRSCCSQPWARRCLALCRA